MGIKKVKKDLKKGPYIINKNNLNWLYINNVKYYERSEYFDKELDDLNRYLPTDKKILINNDMGKLSRRIPSIHLKKKTDRVNLNKIIFKNYDTAEQILLKQSNTYKKILEVPDYETVFLIMVDGLSYERARKYFECDPILVDGISNTKEGMKRITGEKPTIAERMLNKGKENIYGYSYWSREENDLTKSLFTPIPEEDFLTYKKFDEVLSNLKKRDLFGGFVQIVLNGLDGYCHQHRDDPPIDAIIKTQLKNNLLKLEKFCKKNNMSSTIFMTSDHGILWERNNRFKRVNQFNLKDKGKRYTSGKIVRSITKVYDNENYTALKYPFITEKMKRNEWGVHGGLSYEESIVPLIKREV